MADDQHPSCLRYGVRHVLFIVLSTVALVLYLFMVTLIDGWGSRLGNGLGGGLSMLVWLSVPTLSVGRWFAVREKRAMELREAGLIALPSTAIIGGLGLWIGVGMRSDDPTVALTDTQFWALHLGYVAILAIFFVLVLWGRAKLHHTGLSRRPDPDTPPPS